MTDGAAAALTTGDVGALPTWGELNGLCEGEPFGEQPAAAFCSGVLLDWNLVLTSGHCVNALPLDNLRVVFNYYYRADGELALGADDVYAARRVVASRRDDPPPGEDGERLDFAWVELDRPVSPPHRPAAAYVRGRGANESDRVISIGAGGGVPIKWDEGGRVRYTRSNFDDYLIADTDTSQGSSGGGLFDEDLVVLGSLARGAPDFSRSEAGCYVTSRESDPSAAREQFTYVHRAVEALCQAGSLSALCAPSCPEPCDAGAMGPLLPEPRSGGGASCTLSGAPGTHPPGRWGLGPAGLLALALGALRRRHRARRAPPIHQ